MGPQIVDDRTPRGQSIAVRDVGKDGFAVRRIVDAADVFLGDSGFTPVGLKHNQIGGVLNNEPAQLGAVIHPHLIRSPVEAGERPCIEGEQTGGGQSQAGCQHRGRILTSPTSCKLPGFFLSLRWPR